MDSTPGSIHYCSVSRIADGLVLFSYSNGDEEIENLAASCEERAPLFHKWYSHTAGRRTFAFLIDDGYVYFSIADERLGNQGILQFFKNLKNEFKKIAKKYSKDIASSSVSRPSRLQEKFTPVVIRLITLQDCVSESGIIWPAGTLLEPPYATHAPLLGKSNEKKNSRDHMIRRERDIEIEERRKSPDNCVKVDLTSFDGSNSHSASPKDFRQMKRSRSQTIRGNWCRQVRVILAIDAVVCIALLVIWLFVCHGIECVR